MTCWIIREQRKGSECTVEQLVVTGEIQRGANEELIRAGRWLADYVTYEGKREGGSLRQEELDKHQGVFQ